MKLSVVFIYISRSHSEKTTIAKALERYRNEITPLKKTSSQKPEVRRGNTLYVNILANIA